MSGCLENFLAPVIRAFLIPLVISELVVLQRFNKPFFQRGFAAVERFVEVASVAETGAFPDVGPELFKM
jgi:hypothetical protein